MFLGSWMSSGHESMAVVSLAVQLDVPSFAWTTVQGILNYKIPDVGQSRSSGCGLEELLRAAAATRLGYSKLYDLMYARVCYR